MDIDEAILWITFNQPNVYVQKHWLKLLQSPNTRWIEIRTTIKELRSFAYDVLEIDNKFYVCVVEYRVKGITTYNIMGSEVINVETFNNISRATNRMLHWNGFKHTFVLTYVVDGVEHSWVS